MYTTTGIIRNIDKQKRVTLPQQFLDELQLEIDEEVKLYVDGNSIIIEPTRNKCIFCHTETTYKTFYGKPVCPDCVASIGLE